MPSQGQAHKKLRLENHPQHLVGMAEPIRRWLRLALGSKPGLPRGREAGVWSWAWGWTDCQPVRALFQQPADCPVHSSVKILLALCLSVQVKGRKHGVAGAKCKHYGYRSVRESRPWPVPGDPGKGEENVFNGRQLCACPSAPPPTHDVIPRE
ncbi:hypothetical protein V8C26DRAFT_67898 [Trichoderma gracile]